MELTNHFLIAEPKLKYSIFADSVIYITEHNEYIGAVGVVINKPVSKTLNNMFEDINISDYNKSWLNQNLYWGGPIKTNNGFYLKQLEYYKRYELSGDKEYFNQLSNIQNELFMSVGFSMWNPLQLETEIMNNAWMVTKCNPEIIFNINPEDRYREALKDIGVYDITKLYGDLQGFAYN